MTLQLIPTRCHVSRSTSDESIPRDDYSAFPKREVSTPELDSLSGGDVLRIRWKLGHATLSSSRRLLSLSKKVVSDKLIYEAIRKCSRRRLGDKIQNPLMTHRAPPFSGRTVTAGIFYSFRRDRYYRCIVFADALARFAAGTFTKALDLDHMADALLLSRAQWLGQPRRILCDDGTSFRGELRGALYATYGVAIVTAPVEGHFQVGKEEMAIQITKKSLFMR